MNSYLDDDFFFNLAVQESIAIQESNYIHNNVKLNGIIERKPISYNEYLFQLTYNKLNDFQRSIFCDCINKKSAGLSLPLGSGKTLISLVIALYCTRENISPILVVASKSLISSWEFEIKKFFGDSLSYEVVHSSKLKNSINLWKIKSDTQLILTTVDVLAKFYREYNINKKFINQKYFNNTITYTNIYRKPTKPFLNHNIGGGIFFSIKWGCLIVDEVQKYTNIDTIWCQSLGSICSEYRWLLSGTIFDEPKINRILGYHIILNAKGKPRDIPNTKKLICNKRKFKGLNETLISRTKNSAFIPPKVNEYIITHKLSVEEEKIYTTMKKILIEVKNRAIKAKLCNNEEELKKFSSYKLVMIMYLRQALICPLIPITSIAINACDMERRSELSDIIMNEIDKMDIDIWLNDIDSIKSTRINEMLKSINKHPNEKIVIFGCFKSFLDIFQYILSEYDRPIFRMDSTMSMNKRGELIKSFKESSKGILLLTYQLGAEGLNLQFASNILLTDFWWNASKTQQAIGRIFRLGQLAPEINVYFFTANTGIEQILFHKQKAKLDILNELLTGTIKTKIPRLKMDDVIKLIEIEDNKKSLENVKYY